jgi:hypothetical protein
MPCERCVTALQAAADVLQELRTLEPWELPEDTDWGEMQAKLVFLAGILRRRQSA